MSWSGFYLFCFLIGFSLSAFSFFAGAAHLHLPLRWHLPFHLHHHGSGLGKGAETLSWFNASTVLAFLAWFGGTGYLLAKHSRFEALSSLAIAVLAGLVAGYIVFRFMATATSDCVSGRPKPRSEPSMARRERSLSPRVMEARLSNYCNMLNIHSNM